VELTESARRYRMIEVRNASAILGALAEKSLHDLVDVLTDFELTAGHLLDAGGSKSALATTLDEAFRERGWRETHLQLNVDGVLTRQPWSKSKVARGKAAADQTTFRFKGQTHKVDNFKDRVAVEVEWNAKDGNLDRDLSAFRALYDAGVIDAAVIITRHHASVKHAANYLAHLVGRVKYDRHGKEVGRFNTTTTTNLEKLRWRLARGDAGGCPVLAVGISVETYTPGRPWDPGQGHEIVAQPAVPAMGDVEAAVLEEEALTPSDDEADGLDE
jgi:hypothetical protein